MLLANLVARVDGELPSASSPFRRLDRLNVLTQGDEILHADYVGYRSAAGSPPVILGVRQECTSGNRRSEIDLVQEPLTPAMISERTTTLGASCIVNDIDDDRIVTT